MNNTALGNGIEGIFAEEAIKGCSDSQKPRLGYTCTYVPTEILEAAGFIPVRIAPEPSSEKADSFLDPNFCPYVRACLGKAMQGGYEDLVGIVIQIGLRFSWIYRGWSMHWLLITSKDN
ncbi:MAG: 2-hydroxyacyl-CoA dehydratase [Deltaproteobacteria bacterium]|nr:2-hydroxyacyl-CoA dehydratase [Deltaproteobacteria bacterium]